jgi:lipopolysaccharide cholinephosphotransferase
MEEDFSKYNGEGTMLRKAQLRMLEILIEVDKICKKHNIPYWIDYGTLLGAVRHGGFIPWDDDLDISMMKEDYDRFLSIAPKELPEQFVVQNLSTEKYYPITFSKIVDIKTKTIDHTMDFSQRNRKYQGIWIDIFPIIKGNVCLRRWLDPLYGRCYRRVHHFEPFNFSVLIAYLLFPLMWLLKQLMIFLNVFCEKGYRMDEFGLMGSLYSMQKHYRDYLPTKDIKFESIIVPVPNNYEKVLTGYYGNYMQIPPEEKRQIHTLSYEFFDQ